MKIKSFYITASFACLFMLTSCVDYEVKDPNFMPPDVVLDEGDDDEIIEGLPIPGEMQAYSPSLLGKPYRPIKVKYSSQFHRLPAGLKRIPASWLIWASISQA